MSAERVKLAMFILGKSEPFGVAEIIRDLVRRGFKDENMILQELTRLMNVGLIAFSGKSKDDCMYYSTLSPWSTRDTLHPGVTSSLLRGAGVARVV